MSTDDELFPGVHVLDVRVDFAGEKAGIRLAVSHLQAELADADVLAQDVANATAHKVRAAIKDVMLKRLGEDAGPTVSRQSNRPSSPAGDAFRTLARMVDTYPDQRPWTTAEVVKLLHETAEAADLIRP